MWVYYTMSWFQLVLALFGFHMSNFFYFVSIRITDDGSIPEMRIWSMLLIQSLLYCKKKSRWKFCKNVSTSTDLPVFLYINIIMWMMPFMNDLGQCNSAESSACVFSLCSLVYTKYTQKSHPYFWSFDCSICDDTIKWIRTLNLLNQLKISLSVPHCKLYKSFKRFYHSKHL